MPVRAIKKSGSSFVGSFPSLKLGKTVRYESTLERDFFYFLEFDSTVSSYEAQPFSIQTTLDDGKVHKYTPDLLVIQDDLPAIIEIKPSSYIKKVNTLRQIEIGSNWATENNHRFLLITDKEIRQGTKLDNLKLLYRYCRLEKFPYGLWEFIRELFSETRIQIPLGMIAESLSPSGPARSKPYLWSLLFHHHLETNLDQKLSDASPLSLPREK